MVTPFDGVQLQLPRAMRWKLKSTGPWRVNGDRTYPCNHGSMRVKVKAPGVFWRDCDICKTRQYFILEPFHAIPNVLTIRWVSVEVATEWRRRALDDCDVEE